MNTNLKEISNFIKKNDSFSDFNLVNNFLLNLNFTKMNFKKNLTGGNNNVQPLDDTLFKQQSNINSLKLSNIEDKIKTYTIKKDTILYYATSNKKGFDDNYLNFGKDKLISFFTPNFILASDKIQHHSTDKENSYIHVFKVSNDITDIYPISSHVNKTDFDIESFENEFCSQNHNYNGIGFFYPKNNIEIFSTSIYQQMNSIDVVLENENLFCSEFGICNPKLYLKYLYSQKCQIIDEL